MGDERLRAIGALKGLVEKKHGRGIIDIASRTLPLEMPRLRTGSLSLDFALGGGIPVGRLSIFRGMESSGKTTTAMRIAGVAQNVCANCYRPVRNILVEEVDPEGEGSFFRATGTCDCYQAGLCEPQQYKTESASDFKDRIARYEENSYEEFRVVLVDMEGAFDRSWSQRLGVDDRRLFRVMPQTAEDAIDIYEAVLRSGGADLLILDSVAQMVPSKEIEVSTMEWQQGLQARLINKFARLTGAGSAAAGLDFGRPVTHIWINQEREKIGGYGGDTKTMPGGYMQLFAASVIVKMWSSKWRTAELDHDLKKDHHMSIGDQVRQNFSVVKNKTWPARAQGGYDMWLRGVRAGQVDEFSYIMDQAEKYGVFTKEAANKWVMGDQVYRTKGALLATLEQPDNLRALTDALLRRMLEGDEAPVEIPEEEGDA